MNTTRLRSVVYVLSALVSCLLARPAARAWAQPRAAHAYELIVHERWDGSAPGAQPSTPEGDPAAAAWRSATGPSWTVQLSADGQRVELASADRAQPALRGHLVSSVGDARRYALDAGSFAGGRLVLTGRGGALRGELLVYGSGVPIVRGVRGALVPRP